MTLSCSHPAFEAVKAHSSYEASKSAGIDATQNELEDLVEKMEDIQRFLSLLNVSRDQSFQIDWERDHEKRELLVRMMKDPALAYLFPDGKAAWKGQTLQELGGAVEQIGAFFEGILKGDTHIEEKLGHHVSRIITPQMNLKMSKLTKETSEQNQAVDIMNSIVREASRFAERVIYNGSRG